MEIAGEDEIGFRCLAERSRLADGIKDNGVVSMFPPLAEEWWAQVQDQMPWKNFRLEDFERLKSKYGVSWVVVQQPVAGLNCRLPKPIGARLPASLGQNGRLTDSICGGCQCAQTTHMIGYNRKIRGSPHTCPGHKQCRRLFAIATGFFPTVNGKRGCLL